MRKITYSIIVLVLMMGVVAVMGGCGKGKAPEAEAETADAGNEMDGEMSGDHAMHGGIDYVMTADHLYTCGMHADQVSDKSDAKCSHEGCGMPLTEMSAEKVSELRASNPKGCGMCSFVVSGDSELEDCPSCKMKLTTAGAEKEEMAPKEHS